MQRGWCGHPNDIASAPEGCIRIIRRRVIDFVSQTPPTPLRHRRHASAAVIQHRTMMQKMKDISTMKVTTIIIPIWNGLSSCSYQDMMPWSICSWLQSHNIERRFRCFFVRPELPFPLKRWATTRHWILPVHALPRLTREGAFFQGVLSKVYYLLDYR